MSPALAALANGFVRGFTASPKPAPAPKPKATPVREVLQGVGVCPVCRERSRLVRAAAGVGCRDCVSEVAHG